MVTDGSLQCAHTGTCSHHAQEICACFLVRNGGDGKRRMQVGADHRMRPWSHAARLMRTTAQHDKQALHDGMHRQCPVHAPCEAKAQARTCRAPHIMQLMIFKACGDTPPLLLSTMLLPQAAQCTTRRLMCHAASSYCRRRQSARRSAAMCEQQRHPWRNPALALSIPSKQQQELAKLAAARTCMTMRLIGQAMMMVATGPTRRRRCLCSTAGRSP